MKSLDQLKHDIFSEMQYCLPCFASSEEVDGLLHVEADVNLKKILPSKKKVEGMQYLGEDFWGRASFRDENDNYYCEVDGVLYFQGKDQDNDPSYPVKKDILVEQNLDNDLAFRICLDKVNEAFKNHEYFELIDHSVLSKKENRINFLFRFKIKKY